MDISKKFRQIILRIINKIIFCTIIRLWIINYRVTIMSRPRDPSPPSRRRNNSSTSIMNQLDENNKASKGSRSEKFALIKPDTEKALMSIKHTLEKAKANNQLSGLSKELSNAQDLLELKFDRLRDAHEKRVDHKRAITNNGVKISKTIIPSILHPAGFIKGLFTGSGIGPNRKGEVPGIGEVLGTLAHDDIATRLSFNSAYSAVVDCLEEVTSIMRKMNILMKQNDLNVSYALFTFYEKMHASVSDEVMNQLAQVDLSAFVGKSDSLKNQFKEILKGHKDIPEKVLENLTKQSLEQFEYRSILGPTVSAFIPSSTHIQGTKSVHDVESFLYGIGIKETFSDKNKSELEGLLKKCGIRISPDQANQMLTETVAQAQVIRSQNENNSSSSSYTKPF